MKVNIKNKEFIKKISTFLILVFVFLFFTFATDNFFATRNMINILRQVSIIGILTAGMTFVIISGGMDLSVGSQLGLTGVLCAMFLSEFQMNNALSVVLAIMIATCFGLITGFLIVSLNVSAIVITLGMQTVIRGFAYIFSGGIPIYDIPEPLVFLGQGYIGAIPVPVVIMLIIVLVMGFILHKTYFGRYVYAIGGNIEAARLAGVQVNKVLVSLYAISGFLAGIAGVILMGRVSSGAPASGTGTEMEVITAVIIGGISINGGKGAMAGAFCGALIVGMLSNGLTIMNVGQYYQNVITGIVLILAVAFDTLLGREKVKKVKA